MNWDSLVHQLDSILLGVRITQENKNKWVVPCCSVDTAAMLDVKWESSNVDVLPISNGGLYLGGNVYCFQRGYFSEWAKNARIWEQFIEIAASRFNHTQDAVKRVLAPYAWDFLVVVLANVSDESAAVASACLVEYRNSTDISKTPHLYIGDLCTHLHYKGKKIATQICYGVYQLGYMMSIGVVTQGDALARSSENGFLQQVDQLYVALMIKQSDVNVYNRLVHLYHECGFEMGKVPACLDYGSSTPYSPFEFLDAADRIRGDGFHCAAMFREVKRDVIFAYNNVDILDPLMDTGHNGVDFHYMVHSFPLRYLAFVRRHGLIIDSHAILYPNPACEPYVCGDVDGVFFSSEYQTRCAVFVIKVRYMDEDGHIGCSLSSNLAVFIGDSALFKEQVH